MPTYWAGHVTRLLRVKSPHESMQILRGFEPEFGAEKRPERLVLLERGGSIPIGEPSGYQGALGALTQRLGRYGEHPGLDGLPEPTHRGESAAKGFEGPEAELGVVLAADQNPVLRPVREEIPRERGFVQIDLGQLPGSVQDAVGERFGGPKVYRHGRREFKVGIGDFDQWMRRPAESPECRPKTPRGVMLRGLTPERAGDVPTEQGPLMQREEGQQPLGAHRQVHHLRIDMKAEGAEQPESHVGARCR